MKKQCRVGMVASLLFCLNATADETLLPYDTYMKASPDVTAVIVDVGVRCGVDAKKMPMPWYVHVSATKVNKSAFDSAQLARAQGNKEAYESALARIHCPEGY